MTPIPPRFENGPAAHFYAEPFSVAAFPELQAYPLGTPGICFNPYCSQPFEPTRSWQIYCCKACRKQDEAEMRRIGQKAAPALLAWRMGKYEKEDQALRAVSRAGRNYSSRLISDWYADRQARILEGGGLR